MRGIRQSLMKPVQLRGRGADCLFLFLSYERTLIKALCGIPKEDEHTCVQKYTDNQKDLHWHL